MFKEIFKSWVINLILNLTVSSMGGVPAISVAKWTSCRKYQYNKRLGQGCCERRRPSWARPAPEVGMAKCPWLRVSFCKVGNTHQLFNRLSMAHQLCLNGICSQRFQVLTLAHCQEPAVASSAAPQNRAHYTGKTCAWYEAHLAKSLVISHHGNN